MATVFAVTLATNHPEGNVLHLRLQLTFLFLASHHPGYIFKKGHHCQPMMFSLLVC